MGGASLPVAGERRRRSPKRLLALRSDDALVERLRAGDEAAFEVLYERHVAGILGFCRHMLGSHEEAEDAVQQSFASAHRDLLRDGRDIRLKAWLYTIARNRCLSTLRARREQVDGEVEFSTAGLSEEVQRREDLKELVSDLHDLPPDQRAALVLTELGDLSHTEVAEVLGCEVAGVKGLVFRARSGLIERRDARSAPCEEIQQELASARKGALRRGRLRHHLKACPDCTSYLEDVRRQRGMLALALPVIPTLGLKNSVLAATGVGGGGAAAGGGGIAAGLIGIAPATVAKVAVVAVVVGAGGVAGNAVLDTDSPPAHAPAAPPARGDLPDAAGGDPATGKPSAPGERSASNRGELGRKRAASRGRKRRTRGAHVKAKAPKKVKVDRTRRAVVPPRSQPAPQRTAPPVARPAPLAKPVPVPEVQAEAPVVPTVPPGGGKKAK